MAKDKQKEAKTFASLLDTPMSQISRPKPAPHGSYLSMVKVFLATEVNQEGTPFSGTPSNFSKPWTT
jgi:hypothetical protein